MARQTAPHPTIDSDSPWPPARDRRGPRGPRTVHSTGGRALDMNGTLQLLAGPGGLSAGPFLAILGSTLAVGDTEPVTIALDKQVPAGPWEASIALRSGLVDRSARATLTFPIPGIDHRGHDLHPTRMAAPRHRRPSHPADGRNRSPAHRAPGTRASAADHQTRTMRSNLFATPLNGIPREAIGNGAEFPRGRL